MVPMNDIGRRADGIDVGHDANALPLQVSPDGPIRCVKTTGSWPRFFRLSARSRTTVTVPVSELTSMLAMDAQLLPPGY